MSRSKASQLIVSLSVIFALSIGWLPLAGSTAVRAGPQAQGGVIGQPQTGAAGVPESTAQLMQREATAAPSPVHAKPRLRVDRSQLADNPLAPAVAQWPAGVASQRPAAPLVPQTIGISFTGATLADTGVFPPDTMGAVGPTQFIVAVNGRLRSFNKTTGVADGVLNTTMDNFFSSVMTPPVNNNFTSDPRIRYDRLSGRWFVIIIDVPGQAGALANRVLIAMSNTATITAGTVWTFFYFSPDASNFTDYPTLGIDASALYVGANMFSFASAFSYPSAFVVRKSSLTGGGPIVWTPFPDLTGGPAGAGPLTPQGVDNYDPAASEGYFIGVDNASFSTLMIRRVSNPGGTPTLSANVSLTVPTTWYPVTVPHLGNTGGTSGLLDALDDRLFAAHLRNGRLWTAHNINVNTSGVASTTRGRDAVRWYEIQNLSATPSLVQSGTIFDPAAANPLYRWIPSIMVSGQGHAAVGFSSAGAAAYADAATVGRLAGDTLGTMQIPVNYTASTFAYNPAGDPGGGFGRRWGDYSYTSLDPCDDMTMWTIQEFTNATDSYGVRAVKLIAPPPATPSTVSPEIVPQGVAAVTVTITGTAVSGSGFYDTPSSLTDACRQRLVAAVTGGVTVNGVTYISPTLVQMNLSTVGAPPGLKNVTLTNPDGQSLTGIGLIQVASGATYTLSTGTAGNGSGTIALNPPGGAYDAGTVVTATAMANTGSSFAGWSGAVSSGANPVTVTLDSNKSLTATFNLNAYTLSTGTAGSGSGTIALNPPGGVYNYGTVVTVTATPGVSTTFLGWSGDLSGSVNPGAITITGNKHITATFTTYPPVYLPLITRNDVTLSDLIVKRVTASRDAIAAVIKNIGAGPAR